jgi:hypothetical protein
MKSLRLLTSFYCTRNLIPDRAAVHATAEAYHRRENRLIRCLVKIGLKVRATK